MPEPMNKPPESALTGTVTNEGVSVVGERDPSGQRYERYTRYPDAVKEGAITTQPIDTVESELVSQFQPNDQVVSGTDDTRDARSSEVETLLKELKLKAANLTNGSMTADDQANIERARERARLETQALVDQQQQARKTTMARDVVRAGTRGGFENTQEAGIAAVKATNPRQGESFVGVGGELDETRQDLDRAVVLAKQAQQKAIMDAEAAARQAINTRRRDDYAIAKDLYNVANDASEYADTVARDKRDYDQGVKEYEASEKRAIANEERAVAEEERRVVEFNQTNEDRIAESVSSVLVELGKDNEVVLPSFEQIQKLAEETGISAGRLNIAVMEKADELRKVANDKRADALEQAKFEETKKQNILSGEREDRRIGISAGNLALSREKFNEERGQGVEGDEGKTKEFWSAIDDSVKDLQKAESWGTVFNRVKMQFPGVSDEDIDTALGGSFNSATGEAEGWAESGAFEEWKGKQYKPEAPDKEGSVWQWLTTSEAQGLSNKDKKEQIMGAGLDPEDFGIY